CLIKKDRQDQNDPNMSEFYDKLNKAYNDPALMPIKYSGRFSSRRSPLLGSSEPKTISRESSSEDMIV
ncbi:putative membrane protein, partial [Trifolium medium]|nr:putative membrane protein [Trifolium medium]